jgi:redox-sensitive bicupin YhaK (pirin superfamily)
MEIVTWVVDGELEHKDSEGNIGLIYPGLAQRMSAGTGILHSEMNATKGAPVRFVQMWVVPDHERLSPGYEQRDINGELSRGGLVPLASGRGHDAAISIRQENAVLWVGRLAAGERLALPAAPFNHVYVVKGSLRLPDGEVVSDGDALRATLAEGVVATAGAEGAEVLVWEMHGRIAA